MKLNSRYIESTIIKQQFKFIKMEKTVKFKIKADGERDAYTDEEIDAIAGVMKPEELSPEEDAFLDNLADTFV